jgi:hypothetical protein
MVQTAPVPSNSNAFPPPPRSPSSLCRPRASPLPPSDLSPSTFITLRVFTRWSALSLDALSRHNPLSPRPVSTSTGLWCEHNPNPSSSTEFCSLSPSFSLFCADPSLITNPSPISLTTYPRAGNTWRDSRNIRRCATRASRSARGGAETAPRGRAQDAHLQRQTAHHRNRQASTGAPEARTPCCD